MAIKKADQDREFYVVKSNSLIQSSRYSLSLQAQRCLLYTISKIKPTDKIGTEYTVSIRDLCLACGIDPDNHGDYYNIIKRELKELRDRSIWIINELGQEETVSWFSKVKLNKGEGSVNIIFDTSMSYYLFLLQSRYTQYKLSSVLCFKSKYSIRLWELILSYIKKSEIDSGKTNTISFIPEVLKERMDATKYKKFSDFQRFVLNPSVNEINELSMEIHIEIGIEKRGRNTTQVYFIVSKARGKQIINAIERQDEIYGDV